MADIPNRIYRLAQGYLDAARNRLAEIDPSAEDELRRALPNENPDYPGESATMYGSAPVAPQLSAMERAEAKIRAAQQRAAAAKQVQPERYNFSAAAEPTAGTVQRRETDVVETAYRMIGVPKDSPYADVEKAVSKLRERCAPERFPEGSPERAEAVQILRRVDDAFRVLKTSLGVPENRFDKLEL